ncbi:hypothetical protein BT93_L4729 [Corymbia citriodora subsp. variegata]|uniref:NADP-dependent oxidoreductase domain-containing protein n=1 Tax=Corymbia citriodora subsp. variegata TaxID=360336 RepID=A0A8T0CFP4_CORYI|nr:hypothetical protein BT93_L4729 [Corymbia citriodora subsp. variegata]
MSIFKPAPKPKSLLGYHRILSPTAGIRVSPICLGAMNFGEKWSEFLGKCDKETSFGILDFFYESGGNFIDTANVYQFDESEQWLGEWMEKRGNRDQMVIATKFTTGYRTEHMDSEIQSNYVGNSTKSLHLSLEASLKKLKTDYIDLLYVHCTSIEEVMQSLNTMVTARKVLYLGVSDTPAWVVAKANQYARDHGLRPFSVYQGRWACSFRDMEREIIPMCQAEGMAIAPWGALGQGHLKTEQQRKEAQGGRNMRPALENDFKVSVVLEKIAKEKGTELTSVAIAYVMHKTPNVFPILGGRSIKHLKANIEALGLNLSKEEIEEIEDAAPFDPGFPNSMLFGGNKRTVISMLCPNLL